MTKNTITVKKNTLYIIAIAFVALVAIFTFTILNKPTVTGMGTGAGVDFILLNDKDCAACDASQMIEAIAQIFPEAVLREVDISSSEGKQLIEEFGIVYIPAYIFDSGITETEAWNNEPGLPTAFEKAGDRYKILDEATGATHFVDEEKRKEYLESIGIVTGDNRPQIDFFVMSYCPYGNQAEEAIEPVYQLLKDNADFIPHYVIYENYGDECLGNGAYCSMHGGPELHQDVRELCVYEKLGIGKYFEFVLAANAECDYQNVDECWDEVAVDLGLDVQMISDCEANEAIALLAPEKELNIKLGVQGSPTVLIDGEQYNGARTPEGYKAALCAAFEDAPSECDNTLSSSGSGVQGSC